MSSSTSSLLSRQYSKKGLTTEPDSMECYKKLERESINMPKKI